MTNANNNDNNKGYNNMLSIYIIYYDTSYTM